MASLERQIATASAKEALRRLGGRRIGPHLPLAAGLLKAAERAAEIGATALQVFADNPTAWRRRGAPPTELPAFRQRLRELDIGPLTIHGPYLVNLAGSAAEFRARSIATLVTDLHAAAAYGAVAVNIHVGSHKGQGHAAGVANVANGLASVLREVQPADQAPWIVLENSAGGGDGIGSSLEDLAEILEAAARAGADDTRLGFCLDTAHLWGAGVDIGRPEVTDRLLLEFDRLLGAHRLVMLHLNDARVELGSRLDRHEHIGAGRIGRVGLRHLLLHPRLAAVPAFLETPGMDAGFDAANMERVRLLIADEELPELPPEAFKARGSRSRTPPADGGGATPETST